VTEFRSLNHSPGKRVLNNLKTFCLRFWKVVVYRVPVIQLTANNRCGNGTGTVEVEIGADTAKFTNVIITRLRERYLVRASEMTIEDETRFRAELVVLSEQLWILASCCWSRNSVLEEFNINRLAVIHEDMCCRAF